MLLPLTLTDLMYGFLGAPSERISSGISAPGSWILTLSKKGLCSASVIGQIRQAEFEDLRSDNVVSGYRVHGVEAKRTE